MKKKKNITELYHKSILIGKVQVSFKDHSWLHMVKLIVSKF